MAAAGDAVERLVAGCKAYVAFGLSTAARYRVLFSEERLAKKRTTASPSTLEPDGRPVLEFGAESFALLVDGLAACVASGTVDEHRRRG